MLLLAQTCELTNLQTELKGNRYNAQYKSAIFPVSYQRMTIGKANINICATLPNLYELINDIRKAQSDKKHKPMPVKFPQQTLVETIRTGSEKIQCGFRAGKRHYNYVDTYTTKYHDSLVTGTWLEQHISDEYIEPTIELLVDNEVIGHINGNYKKGLIAELLKQYTKE